MCIEYSSGIYSNTCDSRVFSQFSTSLITVLLFLSDYLVLNSHHGQRTAEDPVAAEGSWEGSKVEEAGEIS